VKLLSAHSLKGYGSNQLVENERKNLKVKGKENYLHRSKILPKIANYANLFLKSLRCCSVSSSRTDSKKYLNYGNSVLKLP